MAIEILMPALSPTMTEGKLVKWHKAEGDGVESGDVVAEIETDKATMEIEAVDEGVLGRILVAEGSEGVQVNTAIASLGKVTAQEKAGVMLEFAHFFYEDKPLSFAPTATTGPLPAEPAPPGSDKPLDLGTLNPPQEAPTSQAQEEEKAILHTLEQMRRRLDPGQIDWGRAGYDFGDGFKGPSPDRR